MLATLLWFIAAAECEDGVCLLQLGVRGGAPRCTGWCYNDRKSGGLSWEDKCGNPKCAACDECTTTTTPETTTTTTSEETTTTTTSEETTTTTTSYTTTTTTHGDVDGNAYVISAPEPFVRATVADRRGRKNQAIAMRGCCVDPYSSAFPSDSTNLAEDCEGRGSSTICALKPSGQRFKDLQTWTEARDWCDERGARLCTLAEVHAQELSGVGLHTNQHTGKDISVDLDEPTIVVWTSTPADRCGNGFKAAYEECDDSNGVSGDGCSAQCEVEHGSRCAPCRDSEGSCCVAVNDVEEALHSKLDAHTEAFAVLSRAAVNAQTHVDEMNRKAGGSGVYAARQYNDQFKLRPWERSSYVSDKRGPCGIHNHADHVTTVGMADCGVVLNGYHFRTRHNDYSLQQPVSSSSAEDFNAGEELDWPAVPPGVTGSVANQVAEMKRWFLAWMNQNRRHGGGDRNYPRYFTPQLCYLEGWLEYATEHGKLDDPFVSERHELESATWHDLMDQVRQRLMSGEKSILENGAYMPQVLVDVRDDGMPVRANFQYAIKCHSVEDDVPFQRLRNVADLHSSADPEGRRALFELDPVCSSEYNPSRPFSQTSQQLRNCKRIFKSYLDELMEQIPGKDNYDGDITNGELFDRIDSSEQEAMNLAYYNRGYSQNSKDANGVKQHMRGFSDPNLFVAETTQERVVEFKGTSDRGRRFSWAIPFEILYITPLKNWNPHGILIVDKADKDSIKCDAPRGSGLKCGCCEGSSSCSDPDSYTPTQLRQCAWKGVYKNNYYITPAELFSGEYDRAVDSADTSGGFQWVLDQHGVPQKCGPAGVAIFTNPINGQSVRQRYPVMPRHEEATTVWKELQLVKALLKRKDAYEDDGRGSAAGFRTEARTIFPFGDSSLLETRTRHRLFAADHEHELLLTEAQRRALAHGRSVTARTGSAADGHAHTVVVGPEEDDADEHTVGRSEFPSLGEPELQRVDGVDGALGHDLGPEELLEIPQNSTDVTALLAQMTKQQDTFASQMAKQQEAFAVQLEQQQHVNAALQREMAALKE